MPTSVTFGDSSSLGGAEGNPFPPAGDFPYRGSKTPPSVSALPRQLPLKGASSGTPSCATYMKMRWTNVHRISMDVSGGGSQNCTGLPKKISEKDFSGRGATSGKRIAVAERQPLHNVALPRRWRRDGDFRLERRARSTAHWAVESAGWDPRDLRPIACGKGQPIGLASPQIPFPRYIYENAVD